MNQPSHFTTDWLDKRAKLTPNRIGLVDRATGSRVTFAEWNERVNRTANYLLSLGIGKGDRVAAYASNRAEYVDLFWAAPKIGAILQNLNWRLTVHELRDIVADGEPKTLIYSEDWRGQVEELKPSFTTIEHVVAMTDPGPGERDLAERHAMSSATPDRPELSQDDAWGIYYTGGTTGLPKGAVVTSAIIVENIFGLPGLGNVLSAAIRTNDFMVIYGIVLFITIAVATLMVLVELIYPLLDPRISFGD
jgi:fatty-acyl-CoA synthase